MLECLNELKLEWWILIAMGLFLLCFGRIAWDYLKQIFGGEE
jgi:hypothetical protein